MVGDAAWRGDPLRDEPIDLRGYLQALRRNAVFIAVIMALGTGGVLTASILAPERFDARADLVILNHDGVSTSAQPESVRRQLTTLSTLVTTPSVLQSASRQLGIDVDALRRRVTARTEEQADILSIRATGGSAVSARDAANAVARSFLDQRERTERARLRRNIDRLSREIELLAVGGGGDRAQRQALEERRARLAVAEAEAGSDLQIGQPAELPDAPSGPRPVRNGVLAFFASLMAGLLAALLRDRLSAPVRPLDVATALGAPVLVSLPETGGSDGRAGDRCAACLTLASLIRVSPGQAESRSILVTSAVRCEGRTSIAYGLGVAFARAGERTLLVSADLHRPDLDALCGVEGLRGLREILAGTRAGIVHPPVLAHLIVELEPAGGPLPDVLPSGIAPQDDTTEITDPRAMRAILAAAAGLGYAYVLLDAPPAAGDVPETPVIASVCDEILVVARVERLTAPVTAELRERLDRLRRRPLGIVLIGQNWLDP